MGVRWVGVGERLGLARRKRKGGFQASGAYQAMNSKSDCFQFQARTWTRSVLFAKNWQPGAGYHIAQVKSTEQLSLAAKSKMHPRS